MSITEADLLRVNIKKKKENTIFFDDDVLNALRTYNFTYLIKPVSEIFEIGDVSARVYGSVLV